MGFRRFPYMILSTNNMGEPTAMFKCPATSWLANEARTVWTPSDNSIFKSWPKTWKIDFFDMSWDKNLLTDFQGEIIDVINEGSFLQGLEAVDPHHRLILPF